MSRAAVALVVLCSAAFAFAQEPPPPPPPEAPPPKVDKPPISIVYDGGPLLRSGDGQFELKISNRLQTRFELTHSDADNAELFARFIVPRARVVLTGFVFGDDNRHYIEYSYADNGAPGLKTAYMEKKIVDMVWFRAGLFRRPFNRAELMSDFTLEFSGSRSTASSAPAGATSASA
jgi:hypothetical protein